MGMRFAAVAVISGATSLWAQKVDPNLVLEAAAIRAEVARSNDALQQYTWTERTEVFVKGDLKSTRELSCRYFRGALVKAPVGAEKEQKEASGISKRPVVRKKADMEDYIERAISLIHRYVPPSPEQIQYLLQNGYASLGPSEGGKAQIRLNRYFKQGDSLVFMYDPASKRLLHASIVSHLGSPKDPVTLDADFDTLPDGVNHLGSATLNAKARKIQVRTTNSTYQKVVN